MASPVPTSTSPNHAISVGSRRLGQVLLPVLIVGLCITNALLIKQNRDLKAFISRAQPEFLKPGQPVPPLAANTMSGQREVVNYSARAKTVLLVFKPECPACERTVPYWKAIKAACDRNQYQIFGLSLDSNSKTSDFLKANGLILEVFTNIDADVRNAYKLNLTPLTIVVNNNGRVEKIWPGALNEYSNAEVETYFGISSNDLK